jgi:serine/threonine-protein kinase
VGTDDDSESADPFLAAIARIESEGHPEVRLPGARVGRFTIRAELGRGGMGVVYRADDEQLGRSVALKMLRPGRDTGAARRARFLREARSAAALVHPNVAALYEIGEDSGQLFIAMELVEGEDLRRVLSRGPLPVAEAVRIGLGVARGVSAAHQRGIVHRDLKPENVMLDTNGEPKVLDFGLAKLTESDPAEETLTEEGLRLGTPGYMSPEQASGEALDARTDVFSFGVMLFELLAGRRPRNEAPGLRELRAEVPTDLAELVESCLEKLPARRPETMRAVLDRLTRATTADPVPAAMVKRRSLRSAWLALLVAGGVGVGLVATLALRGLHAHAAPPVAELSDAATAPPPPPVHTLTDYPPPVTKDPSAAAAYAAAMQHRRDGAFSVAEDDLDRAIKLDPTFAAAHLRLLSVASFVDSARTSVSSRQEHFAAAYAFRQQLDSRDRLLLAVGEEMLQSPIPWLEVLSRLRAVLAQYPDDPEALLDLAFSSIWASDPPAARAAAERALVVDPEFAAAESILGITYFTESADEERTHYERCVALSPTAATCLRQLAIFYSEHGMCAEYEDTARRIVAVEPKGFRSQIKLADALAVRGAPIESVRELLDKAVVLQEAVASSYAGRALNDLGLALLVGDFPAAIAAARERDRTFASLTTEGAHAHTAMTIITSLEEEGRAAEATAAAEEFERRSPAWVANDWRVRHYLLYARHHGGKIGDAEFARAFAALEKEATSLRSERTKPMVEIILRASYADASDVPQLLPYLNRPAPEGGVEAWRGKGLLLAGRSADAIAPLRAGAAACAILPDDDDFSAWTGSQAFSFMHSHLWLGEALEATGDTAGACTAYRVVTDRWKNAKPRSITLETAKAHARALHCP